MKSWLEIPNDSDFSIHNLPFGVFSSVIVPSQEHAQRRCATILGDTVVDLSVLEEAGLFADIAGLQCNLFGQSTLNCFLAHPKPVWLAVRQRLMDLFACDDDNDNISSDDRIRNNENLQKAAFYSVQKVQLHLPVAVGDYTDFYSSREHATNGTYGI